MSCRNAAANPVSVGSCVFIVPDPCPVPVFATSRDSEVSAGFAVHPQD